MSEYPEPQYVCIDDSEMDIQTGNAQVVALSTIAQEGYKVVAPVTIEPIGGGDLLRIDIAYFSESYGGRLIVAGATLTYSIV